MENKWTSDRFEQLDDEGTAIQVTALQKCAICNKRLPGFISTYEREQGDAWIRCGCNRCFWRVLILLAS